MSGKLAVGPVEGHFGPWGLLETKGSVVLIDLPEDSPSLGVGDDVTVLGDSDGAPGTARGRRYSAAIKDAEVERLSSPALTQIGRTVSNHVTARLEPFDPGRGLLAGFLIGDTTHLSDSDVEAMRRSGLAHFVAVSGSNVALFLVLVFVVTGPLALGPKRRAVVGLVGLPIYAAATGFEPSVLRASWMAGIALAGRLLGIALEAWQLLSLAVTVLMVADPQLSTNVGFQLSVAATAGVLAGARWPIRRGRVRRALAVTLGAQIAVAPLMLIYFGSVPLLSPLTNLVVAPVVGLSTLVGALGVVGPQFLIEIASSLSNLVLVIARAASPLPQVGLLSVTLLVVAVVVMNRWPRLGPGIAVAGALMAAFVVVSPGNLPPDGAVVVLDVGQGDSILIHGGEERFALVDGGPDEQLLLRKLQGLGVRSLDLVVLTHVHADHATGLVGVMRSLPVGKVWADLQPHQTSASTRFMEAAAEVAPIEAPSVGETFKIGSLTLEVLAPRRRYASPNDQSIVIKVVGSSREMLLTGDIETFAQHELEDVRADILKVPHQGAATSDPSWLVNVGADLAVISVGPNQFGHPAPWVVEVLEESGATVLRTDEVGDVIIELS